MTDTDSGDAEGGKGPKQEAQIDSFMQTFRDAKSGSDNYSSLTFETDLFFSKMEDEDEFYKDRIDRMKPDMPDHPLFKALSGLYDWHYDGDFDGALTAKEELQKAADDFDDDEAYDTAFRCLVQKMRLVASLSGHNVDPEVDRCIDYLEENQGVARFFGSSLVFRGLNGHHLNLFLDTVIERDSDIGDPQRERALEIASLSARCHHNQGSYHAEQDRLEQVIGIARSLEREYDILSAQSRLINSYETFVNTQNRDSAKASVLQNALTECQHFIDKDLQTKWTERIRNYEQNAAEKGEYKKVSTEIPSKEIKEVIDEFKDKFHEIEWRISSAAALWQSALWTEFLPSYAGAEQLQDEYPISELLPRRRVNLEGNPVATSPSAMDETGNRMPAVYEFEIQRQDIILSGALLELIDNDDLTKQDFYALIEGIPGLSDDDRLFLRKATDHYFDEDYAAAYHIAVGRMEGVIRRELEKREQVTNALKPDDSIQSRSLSGLIDIIERNDREFAKYLQYRYSDPEGLNVRNRTAHSQLLFPEMNSPNTIIVLYDVLRAGIRIKHAFQ